MNKLARRELSLYIHIPFCVKKCAYCDFCSFTADEETIARYVKSLCQEISEKSERLSGHEIQTVFMGGGTPTILKNHQTYDIMSRIYACYRVAKDAEISVEANPETVSCDSLSVIKACGFNRISFGVQSLDDRILKRLGRIHSVETVYSSFQHARNAGFDNINMDLMFALPEQSVSDFEDTLNKATALSPEHLSAYSLILEENSEFGKSGFTPVDDEIDREMYELAKSVLKKAGYEHYEISNFAKPGYECRHNCKYWDLSEYEGFGLSAHSFTGGRRYANTGELSQYLKNDFSPKESYEITIREQQGEFMFLGLRMMRGVSVSDFFEKFGISVFNRFGDELTNLLADGLINHYNDRIYLTNRGIDISNIVFAKFI